MKTSPSSPASVAASASQPMPSQRTMWQHLKSPAYLFGKAPTVALVHMFILAAVAGVGATLISSIIGILALPLVAIAYAVVERWRLAKLGYESRDNHVPMSRDNLLDWIKFRYTELATWRETGVLLILIIVGSLASLMLVAEFTLFATAIGMMIGVLNGLTVTNWGLYSNGYDDWEINQAQFAGPNDTLQFSLPDLDASSWWFFLLAALIMLPVFAYLNGLLVAASASLNAMILAPRAEEFERQVSRLSESRTKIVDAFESERRRIERDLHDGVQQELVNINMRLGLAEMEAKKLVEQGAADSVLTHVTEARAQLSHAQQTLRNTVRGIYPAVLEDHGLKAALEELAHGCAVPTRLTYYAQGRMAPEIERTAYFAASEGITNALKHAAASSIDLDVREATGYLQVSITDNGKGGANPDAGTGLAGLGERAQALGGSFTIESGAGGTSLQMKLPIS